jgi:hypothetical protein
MANHRQLAILRPAAVDVTVAAAHRPEFRTKISACRVEQRLAEGSASRLIADERRKDIALPERQAARGADGLLATAEVDAADDHAAAVERAEFVLENSRLQHDAEGFEILGMRRSFGLVFRLRFRRLKHPQILAATLRGRKRTRQDLKD